MDRMFAEATSFNQSLDQWNTRNVRSMINMFYGVNVNAFNHDLAPAENAHDGRAQWEASRLEWQVKWATMQQQQPETVAKVREAYMALYDEWSEDEERQDELQQCVTCSERRRTVIYIECGHFIQCDECYVSYASSKGWDDVTCPLCRKKSHVKHIDEYLLDHLNEYPKRTVYVTQGGRARVPSFARLGHRSLRPMKRASPTNRRGRHSPPARGALSRSR